MFDVTKPTCYEYEVMLGHLRLYGPLDEYNEIHLEDKIDKTVYRMSSFKLLEGVLSGKDGDLIYRDMKVWVRNFVRKSEESDGEEPELGGGSVN